jgi:carbon monoxide dehydrogenase subunit G
MLAHTSMQGFVQACLLRACLLLGCCGWAASAAAQSPVRSIDVAYDGDTYVVTAHMFAPVSQSIAWDVLTDFANMAAWVPNVRQSSVVKKSDNQLTIEQSGTAKFGLLSFSYTSVREIVLTPQTTIQSTQTKGDMKRQQSLMELSPEANGTRLQYRLELEPSGLASAAISQDRLKHDIDEQFTAIVGEMVRRKK